MSVTDERIGNGLTLRRLPSMLRCSEIRDFTDSATIGNATNTRQNETNNVSSR